MHKFLIVFLGVFLINISSCGVPKKDYEALKAENVSLREELDMFRFGEERMIALIEQAVNSGNISEAKENIILLQKYHPEAMGKAESKRVIAIVDKKEAAEKAERLKRQQGFENPYAADAQVLDIAEAELMESNQTLSVGSYYIIRGYFAHERSGSVYIFSKRNWNYYGNSWVTSGAFISVNSDSLLKLAEGTYISLLVQAFEGHLRINPNAKVQGFSLVEWKRN